MGSIKKVKRFWEGEGAYRNEVQPKVDYINYQPGRPKYNLYPVLFALLYLRFHYSEKPISS